MKKVVNIEYGDVCFGWGSHRDVYLVYEDKQKEKFTNESYVDCEEIRLQFEKYGLEVPVHFKKKRLPKTSKVLFDKAVNCHGFKCQHGNVKIILENGYEKIINDGNPISSLYLAYLSFYFDVGCAGHNQMIDYASNKVEKYKPIIDTIEKDIYKIVEEIYDDLFNNMEKEEDK